MHGAAQLWNSWNIFFQYIVLQITASEAHIDNNIAVPQLKSSSPKFSVYCLLLFQLFDSDFVSVPVQAKFDFLFQFNLIALI